MNERAGSALKPPARRFGFSAFWPVWALIILVYAGIRVNTLDIPLDRDEGIFGYAGQVILNGGLPYREVLEHKPPAGFYIYALALTLVPPTAAGIHLFLHIYNFLTLTALYRTARLFFGGVSAGLWTAFVFAVFSSSPAIQGFTASTEMLLLLPLSLSLLGAVKAAQGRRPLLYSWLSGVCGALAFWTKPTAAVILVFVVLFAAMVPRPAARRLLSWAAGFLALSTVVAGYFVWNGLLRELIYWTFTHNLHYSQAGRFLETLPRLLSAASGVIRGNALIVAAGVCAGAAGLGRDRGRAYFSMGLLLFSVLSVFPGLGYRHYLAQAAPALALAGGAGLDALCGRFKQKGARRAAALLCAAAVVLVPVRVHWDCYGPGSKDVFSHEFFDMSPFPESEGLAAFIARRTAPSDSIFIFGSEAQVYLQARRRSATPFAMLYPMTRTKYPRYREFQASAWEALRAAMPAYIVYVNIAKSLLWDGRAELWIQQQVAGLINRDYYLEAVMTVENPRGRLIELLPTENPAVTMERERPPILIYRKRKL